MKESRTAGTDVCADLTAESLKKFNLEMWYEPGLQCIEVNMYRWFAANGVFLKIEGKFLNRIPC